jgi:hypothetical protein
LAGIAWLQTELLLGDGLGPKLGVGGDGLDDAIERLALEAFGGEDLAQLQALMLGNLLDMAQLFLKT